MANSARKSWYLYFVYYYLFQSFLILISVSLFWSLLVNNITHNSLHGIGLKRCGKSCRLRWANYLRPDIKRGEFTEDEELSIISLHALHGNKLVSLFLFLKCFEYFPIVYTLGFENYMLYIMWWRLIYCTLLWC